MTEDEQIEDSFYRDINIEGMHKLQIADALEIYELGWKSGESLERARLTKIIEDFTS